MISKQLLEELKEIFKSDYGVSLSDDFVSEIGSAIFQYYEVLLKVSGGNNET